MRRAARRALLAAAAAALAACGSTTEVREPDVVVRGGTPQAPVAPARTDSPRRADAVRIAVVTHGQASSPFWVTVRNGIDAAARQVDASVSYRSPDTYSVPRMRALVDSAVDARPDGLVVSLPSVGLAGSVRRAVRAGIPVISINSGSDISRRMDVLTHVGQPEARAGRTAGERLARAGVRRALCVIHEPGNAGLDARCTAFGRALRRAGGRSEVLPVDVQDRAGTRQQIDRAIRDRRADGVLTLNTDSAEAALDATRSARTGRVRLATFDLSGRVLEAVRDGRMRFAVDQQAYLQGYLPIMLLTQRIRYGLFPGEGEVVATGPSLVTRANAAQVIRLSNRGIR
jgi:simple sugar transport system substrate-binding protein